MIDIFISFLKNDTNVFYLWLIVFAELVILWVIRYLKLIKISTKLFNRILTFSLIILLFFMIGNILITKNYFKFWQLAIVIIAANFSRFLKWYDNKVDKTIDRL